MCIKFRIVHLQKTFTQMARDGFDPSILDQPDAIVAAAERENDNSSSDDDDEGAEFSD